ncbi:MAG: hypothetical protein GFH27_549297n271 [Chloroflexi bacterium AL-W]|nr:hypothetical protein [Chloroflexi bacterium AL-N1]NOK68876.1 hypothetical protein [Chloroflexi bacterium AL-N10]NOK76859.1 hypothetical protein [Chloroflexi bacterium AL-N5]NOK82753.1 hypothetical protein [Chloroflexi bacterium AL-W]NOK90716.1 hypothetical protein [Chloroflexi bacterium AL-N15]
MEQLLQQKLEQMVEAGLPGAFIYIEEADKTTHFYTAGFADLVHCTPMTPDSHYRIGSHTKTFTAVVVLQLINESKLNLHGTMRDLVPDLAIPNAERLTIEHLLRMRSGLFDFEDDPSLLGDLDAHLRPYGSHEMVQLALQHQALFLPGQQFAYCNTNFCLLELIVERVTGHSLGTELQQRIFEPLAMSSTSYPDENDLSLPTPYIRGYEYTGDAWRECSHSFFGRGDGAIISTASDQARFFRALLGGVLLPEALLQQMMIVVPEPPHAPPARFAYGLGLIAHATPCGTVWGHSGGGFGYINYPFLQHETGRFAVCMLNGTFGFKTEDPLAITRPRFTDEIRARIYC